MTEQISLVVNGAPRHVGVEPRRLLVQVIREDLGLTGTHVGCDTTQCGACTVHVDGQATRSCVVPVAGVEGRDITTIEGLGTLENLHVVQQAWIEEQVPQCGYCQPGMIMAVAAFLEAHPEPDDEAINRSITNICRCGTYPRIRRAIYRAAELRRGTSSS